MGTWPLRHGLPGIDPLADQRDEVGGRPDNSIPFTSIPTLVFMSFRSLLYPSLCFFHPPLRYFPFHSFPFLFLFPPLPLSPNRGWGAL